MDYIQFTDFRNHSKDYFEKIEDGESYIIVRKGIPVARIIPFKNEETGWKRETKRVKLSSTHISAAAMIIEERNEQ